MWRTTFITSSRVLCATQVAVSYTHLDVYKRQFKRRGKGAQSTTLRQTDIRDQASPIPMDGVAILRRALEMTEELAANAPNAIKDRLWLYRSAQRGQGNGKTLCLTMGTMAELTRTIIERHAPVSYTHLDVYKRQV